MTVIDPMDATEITGRARSAGRGRRSGGPVYLRGLRGEVARAPHAARRPSTIGRSLLLRNGGDAAFDRHRGLGQPVGRSRRPNCSPSARALEAPVLHVPTLKLFDSADGGGLVRGLASRRMR